MSSINAPNLTLDLVCDLADTYNPPSLQPPAALTPTEAFLLLWSLPGSGLSNLDYVSEHESCCKSKGQGIHTEAEWKLAIGQI